MKEIYENYTAIIIFLHIISAVIWIGGMIAIRLAVHPTIGSIEDDKLRLEKTLLAMRKLFHLVLPFIALIVFCGIVLVIGGGFTGWKVHTKEAIWTVMLLNYIYMYIQRFRASRAVKKGNLPRAKELVRLLPNRLLPLNIILGLVAIFLGVMLRGY
jgi:uncharacterized membrane protein